MRTLTRFIQTLPPNTVPSGSRIRIRPLKGDGSDRRVYRLFLGKGHFILIAHPRGEHGLPSENDSFCYICRHLGEKKLPVPMLYAADRRRGLFLMQDFGDAHLEDHIKKMRSHRRRIVQAYQTVLKGLVQLQIEGAQGFDTRYCYDTPVFDGLFSWKRETRYFLEAFCRGVLGCWQIPQGVEEELKELAFRVDEEKIRLFLHRDFQSRNLMVWSGGIGIIDFQAARLGPPQYDLASLLIDPYVGLSEDIQEELLEFYLGELSVRIPLGEKDFRERYAVIAFQRNLQILGAFAFLSRVKGKTAFADHIPMALGALKRRITQPPFRPYRRTRTWIAAL